MLKLESENDEFLLRHQFSTNGKNLDQYYTSEKKITISFYITYKK